MIFVLSQRSSVSHFVPRTVAAPLRPRVRKLPLPSPHSRRTFFSSPTLDAFLPFGQLSAPTSASWVIGFLPRVCVTTNAPE